MKGRVLWISLILVMIFSFAACNANPSESNNPVEKIGDKEWIWVGQRNKQGCLSPDGYYYLHNSDKILCYADLIGKGNMALCTKVGCSHNSSDCEAYLVGFMTCPMFFWENHLYYVDEVSSQALYRRDATGLNLMEVGTIGKKYLEAKQFLKIESFAQAGDYIYYYAQTDGGETNDNNTSSAERYIGRFHLSTGKDEVLVEQFTNKRGATLSLCAISQDGVLFFSSEGVDVAPEDDSFTEAYGQMSVSLNYWSEETGEITKLFTKTRSECSEIQLVWDGKVYYVTQGNVNSRGDQYTYDLNAGKEERICENTTLYHYGGGFALHRSNGDERYLVYNLKTGQVLPMELYGCPRLCAHSDTGIVISKYVMEENTTNVKENVYCYVTYESLADGLQESDLTPLYTQKMGYS